MNMYKRISNVNRETETLRKNLKEINNNYYKTITEMKNPFDCFVCCLDTLEERIIIKELLGKLWERKRAKKEWKEQNRPSKNAGKCKRWNTLLNEARKRRNDTAKGVLETMITKKYIILKMNKKPQT